jgi:hypothetical protein
MTHKRAVMKHRRKRSLFGRAFTFLGQKSDKNQNQTGRSGGQNKKVALLAGGVLG